MTTTYHRWHFVAVAAFAVSICVGAAAGLANMAHAQVPAPTTEAKCLELSGTWASNACTGYIGDGIAKAQNGDNISEIQALIQDHGGENLTMALTIFAYVLGFGIALTLLVIGIRRVLSRIMMLVGSG
jgi:hypothetical protein